MTSFLVSGQENNCCGCRACEQVCPVNCIKMEHKEGFLYPKIDKDKCIACGLCTKTCQYSKIDELFHTEVQTTYSAWHEDTEEILKSTSGAAFAAISDYVLSENGIVYGAALDLENKRVVTRPALTKEERESLRKSKYVWCDTESSYKSIQEELRAGKKVLFSGTPCQVAGLRSFLRKDYENLFCIDILCHGVPSVMLLQSYIEYLEEKYRAKIIDFEFRHKCEGFMQTEYCIRFDNGDEIHENLGENPYSLTYNSLIAHMPACNTCPYAATKRVSDITIGDFWGIEHQENGKKNSTGTSVVIANTTKGRELLLHISKLKKYQNDITYARKYNPPLRYAVKRHPWNKKFMKSLTEKGFAKTYRLYIQYGNKVMLIYRVFRKLNALIKRK